MRALTDREIKEMMDKYYQEILDVLRQADDWLRQNVELIYYFDRYTAKEIKELLIATTVSALKEIDDILDKAIAERRVKTFSCGLERLWQEGELDVWVSCKLVMTRKKEDRYRKYEIVYVYHGDKFKVTFTQNPDVERNVTEIEVTSEPMISEKQKRPTIPINYVDIDELSKTPGALEKVNDVLKSARTNCGSFNEDRLRAETVIAYNHMIETVKEYTNKEVNITCNVADNCQDVECKASVPNDEDDILSISYLYFVTDIDGKLYTILHQEYPILGGMMRKINIVVTSGGVFLREESE